MVVSAIVADKRAATAPPAFDPKTRARLGVGAPTRGRTGKTTLLRAIIETSPRHRRLRILDAETRQDGRLSDYFPEAERAPSNAPADRRKWLEDAMEDQASKAGDPATAYDMIIDFPGGDNTLKNLGREVEIVNTLEESGVDITAIYAIGPSVADLSELQELEARKLFCPKRTVLAVNAGLISTSQSVTVAFEQVFASPIVKGITDEKRGGKLVILPALPCMPELENQHIRKFSDCLEGPGRAKIGMFNAKRVRGWLKEEIPSIRAELGDWIP